MDSLLMNLKKYIKHIFARDTLLAYLDLNSRFYIHTDASDYHLAAEICQSDKPITFYIQKLNGPQNRDTVTEKE